MIPLYKPNIEKKEIKAVLRVLRSGKLSRGKEIDKFEKEFAIYTKQKYAVAVNSGTSGLHLAARSIGWKKGDEVITTPFSYIASANVLLFEGVKPIFVDIDPLTLNIDANKIEEKITANTKGILLVHTLGLPIELDRVSELKRKYKLRIVEDVCEAIGRPTNTFNVAKLGDISVFGFHENKQLTTGGEGGMITTNSYLLAKKCRSMRDQGRSFKKNWINDVILGFNFRMTEMQAAFGRTQLKSLDKALKRRNEIAKKYSYFLKKVDGIVTPDTLSRNERSWFAYFILFKKALNRNLVYESLYKMGICSSINCFPPIYKFPMYVDYRGGCYKNTEGISKRILVLPIYYKMTNGQVKLVTDKIKEILNK